MQRTGHAGPAGGRSPRSVRRHRGGRVAAGTQPVLVRGDGGGCSAGFRADQQPARGGRAGREPHRVRQRRNGAGGVCAGR